MGFGQNYNYSQSNSFDNMFRMSGDPFAMVANMYKTSVDEKIQRDMLGEQKRQFDAQQKQVEADRAITERQAQLQAQLQQEQLAEMERKRNSMADALTNRQSLIDRSRLYSWDQPVSAVDKDLLRNDSLMNWMSGAAPIQSVPRWGGTNLPTLAGGR